MTSMNILTRAKELFGGRGAQAAMAELFNVTRQAVSLWFVTGKVSHLKMNQFVVEYNRRLKTNKKARKGKWRKITINDVRPDLFKNAA